MSEIDIYCLHRVMLICVPPMEKIGCYPYSDIIYMKPLSPLTLTVSKYKSKPQISFSIQNEKIIQ